MLRLPNERILRLVPLDAFLGAGLQVVRDESAQLVLQKVGIPALGISDARIKGCLLYTSPSPRDA